jgi:hypothetical protein
MSTSTEVDLSQRKVVHDERVKERNRLQRLLIRPEMGALIGAVVIFIFFFVVAPPFRSPDALATVLYGSSTIGIMACAVALLMIGGEFDLSAGVAVTTSSLAASMLAYNLHLNLGADPGAGDWVLQRVSGDENQDPELLDHVGHLIDVDRREHRCDQIGFGSGRDAERERHAGLGIGACSVRVDVAGLRRGGARHRVVVAAVYRGRNLRFVQDADW